MQIVVGVSSDPRSADALAFAVLWARAARSTLVVTHVMPEPWPAHGPGSVDAEWVAYLRSESAGTLDRARALVPEDVEARYVIGEHGGSGRGLASVAAAHDGRLVVIGSAPDARPGSIRLGSTGDQLLHGAPCPVTVVPEGFAGRRVPALDRISVAYSRTVDADTALVATRQLVERTGLPIRLVTLVQYPPRRFPGATKALDEIRADARLWLEQVRASVPDAEAEIAEGEDIASALGSLDWLPGESLLVGSAEHGPLSRVFLGATANKILRAATVPVTVLPRGVDPELESTHTIPRVQ
ncbi:MAG TPA: universal stress protein [Candidatus Limnocylindria bacterium]|nr:universal stress protein [Candidatus Limnocylindria bacterium]